MDAPDGARLNPVARGRRAVTPRAARWLGFALLCVAAVSGAIRARAASGGVAPAGWFAFDPGDERPKATGALDLRPLNERFAGEHGFIVARDGGFVHADTGAPIRFWGVTGPARTATGDLLRASARALARYGVNLVRVHMPPFDARGEVDPAAVRRVLEIVEAMRAEGIYTHLSIFFPLWLQPAPGTSPLRGYDGKRFAFATLFFDPAFQAQYRRWWAALLTTPGPSGRAVVDDPAVAFLEMVNEDSLLFATLDARSVPDPEMRLLETAFGAWASARYGSTTAAMAAWGGRALPRDAPGDGRLGIRALGALARDRTRRDQDTAAFLLQAERRFYRETYAYLRGLGFKGAITASNWKTVSPERLGPLEKLAYMTGDFVDRHGYFGCDARGAASEWSIRPGHTYADRSALRFDSEDSRGIRDFLNPVMDAHYDAKPSMISETAWNRPNRFRSEAPLYLAAYGALQHSDAIVHFALDSTGWTVQPRPTVMQPWTLMSPAMLAQFPAAALLYRQGLVSTAPPIADVALNVPALLRLEGTPLPEGAVLDERRLGHVVRRGPVGSRQRVDPLLHYVGRVDVRFTDGPRRVTIGEEATWLVDRPGRTVVSTTGELRLDYGRGVLVIDAARAQGASGDLGAAGVVETRDLRIASPLDLVHVVVVALDGLPLSESSRMLLQVMTEEKASGFETEPASRQRRRIRAVGSDPWLVKAISGTVVFKRPDAASLRVTQLDLGGAPEAEHGDASRISLRPDRVYYLIRGDGGDRPPIGP